MRNFDDYYNTITKFVNALLMDVNTKKVARETLMTIIARAYLDKSGKLDDEMKDFLKYCENKRKFDEYTGGY